MLEAYITPKDVNVFAFFNLVYFYVICFYM